MKTEIINIGDELLIGQVINTNASWMSEQLSLAGFPVSRVTIIPDDQQQILDALKESGERAELILITGGLGPTKDDITKNALCNYFRTKLIFDTETFKTIERFFNSRGFPVTAVNRCQAEVPENCRVIPNANGTAPGMWFELDKKKVYISMPGVPFEMKGMMMNPLIPMLKKYFKPVSILHHTFLTQGIGESFLSDHLEEWETHLPSNIHLAYLPQPGIVRLRLTGQSDDESSLQRKMKEEGDTLRSLIQDYIFGEGDTTLEQEIGILLKEKQLTLSTAESCTGGYIAHLITSVPGSSAYYKGSIIAYSNEIKQLELNVSELLLKEHGAVSEQVVRQMAENVRTRFKTNYAIAISGIAGPDGGTPEKPVGLVWIAIASTNGTEAIQYHFGDNRERNIRRASLQAIALLRKAILQH